MNRVALAFVLGLHVVVPAFAQNAHNLPVVMQEAARAREFNF
jgi:hypothetical protein